MVEKVPRRVEWAGAGARGVGRARPIAADLGRRLRDEGVEAAIRDLDAPPGT